MFVRLTDFLCSAGMATVILSIAVGGCAEPVSQQDTSDLTSQLAELDSSRGPAIRGFPDLKAGSQGTELNPHETMPRMDSPFIMPLLKTPTKVPIGDVQMLDNAEVIGVTCGDTAVAYSCKAMSQIDSHVINDVIDDTPLAVTFCDRTNTARVFCGETGTGPTEFQVGGMSDTEMVLLLDGKMYQHTSHEIPVGDYQFVRTTFGQWKQQHPDSMIYMGK